MKQIWLALIAGFILDLILGDPHSIWHPVCGIGSMISLYEKLLRKIAGTKKSALKAAGFALVVMVTGSTCLIAYGILRLAYFLNPYLGFAIQAVMSYQLLATKSLKDESMKVYDALKNKGLPEARKAVSMIVGRDTQNLSEEGVTKAAVETVAENTSDGILAPMIFLAIGGPVLGFFYKAVNTMDSCVGYKNENYMDFGFAAAKLDDILNYIPARISAWVMIAATIPLRLNTKSAAKIYLRDRYNHASPNSAHTEAVMAGALEVQLAGDAYYFGKLCKKKTIGDPIRPIEIEDIRRANGLLYMTATLAMILISIIYGICLML